MKITVPKIKICHIKNKKNAVQKIKTKNYANKQNQLDKGYLRKKWAGMSPGLNELYIFGCLDRFLPTKNLHFEPSLKGKFTIFFIFDQ